MKTIYVIALALVASAIGVSGSAFADDITCGSDERWATLGSSEACETGAGNPDGSDIGDLFPPDTWTDEGELTDDGTDDFLTVLLDDGVAWGDNAVSGTWEIAAGFWTSYADAVISMHVGNGNGDPDFWAWLITSGETSGSFSYEDHDGTGGGLSNMRLWGRGTPVPEPGALLLMGIGLIGLGLRRRRRAN